MFGTGDLSGITGQAVIELENIGVTFKGSDAPIQAIDDVSLNVKSGEFISLIGHSGCGKSTLLRVIGDIIAPTTGIARIFGGRLWLR